MQLKFHLSVSLYHSSMQVSSFDCTGKQNGFNYPDPVDCAAFWICVHGKPMQKTCDTVTGRLFDPHLQICNWPAAVDCGSRTGKGRSRVCFSS